MQYHLHLDLIIVHHSNMSSKLMYITHDNCTGQCLRRTLCCKRRNSFSKQDSSYLNENYSRHVFEEETTFKFAYVLLTNSAEFHMKLLLSERCASASTPKLQYSCSYTSCKRCDYKKVPNVDVLYHVKI